MIDKGDLKYQFEKKRHELMNSDKFLNYFLIGMPSIVVLPMIGGLWLSSIADTEVTDKTSVVLENFQNRLEKLEILDNKEIKANYIHDLLLEDNLSEQQASKLESDFYNKFGDIEDITGYPIGKISDLRECRTEHKGDDVKEIAACTVDKSMDEIAAFSLAVVNTMLVFLLAGCMLIESKRTGRPNAINWLNEKPVNPKFRH